MDDAVHFLKKGACGYDIVATSREQSGGFVIDLGHESFIDGQVDEVNLLLVAICNVESECKPVMWHKAGVWCGSPLSLGMYAGADGCCRHVVSLLGIGIPDVNGLIVNGFGYVEWDLSNGMWVDWNGGGFVQKQVMECGVRADVSVQVAVMILLVGVMEGMIMA